MNLDEMYGETTFEGVVKGIFRKPGVELAVVDVQGEEQGIETEFWPGRAEGVQAMIGKRVRIAMKLTFDAKGEVTGKRVMVKELS